MGKYDDIIHMQRPVHDGDDFSRRHPPMPVEDRAKIFMPFAALKGYGETVAKERITYDREQQVSEEMMAELNAKLQALKKRLEEGEAPRVTVDFFERAEHGNGHNPLTDGEGHYRRMTGEVRSIDTYLLRLLVEETWIDFHALRRLQLVEQET